MGRSERRVLLAGGCGFVGCHLTRALVDRGMEVLTVDVIPLPPTMTPYVNRVQYQKADLSNASEMAKVLQSFKPDIVVSIAGWGMSTFDMLNPKCWAVNYEGTRNLLQACIDHNVSRFVFTSTYNVVYCGREIADGDESYPYAADADHVDEYSKSKTWAERYVLERNNTTLPDSSCANSKLITAAIRPGAIYGEDEQRHLPRIARMMDLGLYSPCRIGNALVDWLHVDNLVSVLMLDVLFQFCDKVAFTVHQVQAYLLLIDKLMHPTACAQVAGQAYFISDGTPITNTDFLAPLCSARRRPLPYFTLPTSAVYFIAGICETLYRWHLPTMTLFTRAEVLKMGFTHYFKIAKAKKHLGYQPTVTSTEGALRIAEIYAVPLQDLPRTYFAFAHMIWYFLVLTGMVLLWLVAYFPADAPLLQRHLSGVYALSLFLFRSQVNLRLVFVLAVIAHVVEALYAMILAHYWCYMQPGTVLSWTLQTLLLGYPSLQLLLRHEQCTVRPHTWPDFNKALSLGKDGSEIKRVSDSEVLRKRDENTEDKRSGRSGVPAADESESLESSSVAHATRSARKKKAT